MASRRCRFVVQQITQIQNRSTTNRSNGFWVLNCITVPVVIYVVCAVVCGKDIICHPYKLMPCVVGCSGVIDLAFVLHSAGTVHPERWRYMKQFVIDAVRRLDVGADRTRVAVITWSDTAHVGFTLDQFTTRQDVIQVPGHF